MDQAVPFRFRDRLREKLPEIVIEACSVALAVMLALWAGEWRDNRELDRDAAKRQSAVAAELAGNLEELKGTAPKLKQNLAVADRFLADPDKATSLNFDLQLALLSAAAWNTAQFAASARRFDSEWSIPVARTYELQALYLRQQQTLVDSVADIAVADEHVRPSTRSVRQAAHSLRTLIALNEQLASAYRETLELRRSQS